MIEILRHAFGLCGDSHPTIFYLLGAAPVLFMSGYFKSILKFLFVLVKNYVR